MASIKELDQYFCLTEVVRSIESLLREVSTVYARNKVLIRTKLHIEYTVNRKLPICTYTQSVSSSAIIERDKRTYFTHSLYSYSTAY